jgi:2-oxoacid:acceptor oxidoreductase gamma subunit (pyruvate/2-ketoisovalerate family)
LTNKIYEIRWHGRGGQGAVTAARIVAEAAFLKGHEGVTATPSFGAERRGVPVSAATRFSTAPIRILSQVVEPDIVVVLDQTLLAYKDTIDGLKDGGLLVVNSDQGPEDIGFNGRFNITTADATTVCHNLGLIAAGITMVNIAILGSLARATKLVDMENLVKVIKMRFNGHVLDTNLKAINKTYQITKIGRRNHED